MRPSALRVKSAVKERRQEERRLRREAILAAAKRVYSGEGLPRRHDRGHRRRGARQRRDDLPVLQEQGRPLRLPALREHGALHPGAHEDPPLAPRPDRKLRAAWDFFYRFREEFPESYRIFFLFHHQGFPAAVPPATSQELNRRAGRNFALAAAMVKEAMAAGIYREGNPREVVDLLWSMFMGLVHPSETRENLRLSITTLKGLHARAFEWLEAGLRRRT